MKSIEYDFNPTKDYKEASSYEGFIAPNGLFYKVSKRGIHVPTHGQWADLFVKKNTDYVRQLANPSGSFLYTISRLKDKQQILQDFYGFIYYSHEIGSRKPIIILPNYNINNKEVTDEQSKMLWDILYINNEIKYFPNELDRSLHDASHEEYVDSFIEKLLGGKK